MEELKKHWKLNYDAFHTFLKWLDEGVDSAGDSYLEMRRRLVSYFDRKNCPSPEELADQTLDRVARKLEERGAITDIAPAQYCYVVAKFVFLESVREVKPKKNIEEIAGSVAAGSDILPHSRAASGNEDLEKMLDRLEACLRRLPGDEQALILAYYQGDKGEKIERRRSLATRLDLSLNALSIRACRIRGKLEDCVRTRSATK